MRVNLRTLEEMLNKLECKFASQVYMKMVSKEYNLKKCEDKIDILDDYIKILKEKIKLLKYKFIKFQEKNTIFPSYIRKTSLDDFYSKEIYLNNCDKRFLEKIKSLI